jgi:MtN3 and saliva related transmembrane protein
MTALYDWIGLVAATLTTGAFIPQVVTMVKTKQTRDLSACLLVMMLAGVTVWLVYGLLTNNLPTIVSSTVMLPLIIYMNVQKMKNWDKDRASESIDTDTDTDTLVMA